MPQVAEALVKAKNKGLVIPVVYNSSAYENVSTLNMLDGLVDVYLPDMKYIDSSFRQSTRKHQIMLMWLKLQYMRWSDRPESRNSL